MSRYQLEPDRARGATRSTLRFALCAMLTIATSSCSSARPAPAGTSEGVVHGAVEASSEDAPGAMNGARALDPSATFGTLVELSLDLDQTEGANSSEGCLLGGIGSGADPFRLAADLSVAVRPMPTAPLRLGPRFDGPSASPRVLTVWGSRGQGGLGLVVFTSTPPLPDARLAVLALTSRGVFLRSTEDEPTPPLPFPPNELPARLTSLRGASAVIVTADRDTTLFDLRAILGDLARLDIPIALAVALPEGTRLPAGVPSDSSGEVTPGGEDGWCPEGLDLPPDGAPEGTLVVAGIRSALAPFVRDAPSCFAAARSGMGGGRYELALRVDADGRVDTACAMSDTAGDADLRDCLLRRVRSIRFPRPEPAGFVDIALPVELSAATLARQRPLCD